MHVLLREFYLEGNSPSTMTCCSSGTAAPNRAPAPRLPSSAACSKQTMILHLQLATTKLYRPYNLCREHIYHTHLIIAEYTHLRQKMRYVMQDTMLLTVQMNQDRWTGPQAMILLRRKTLTPE